MSVSRRGSILLVGAGALGCSTARVLAGSAIARLTIIDPDRVEHSNLQRQVLYGDADVGELKVHAAAERLRETGIEIEPLARRLDASNARDLIAAHDFTVDGCDDPATKFLVNSAAAEVGRPFTYGGVTRTSGLVMTVARSACLACAFPDVTPHPGPNAETRSTVACHDAGVVAPVAGVIGALQALHALAMLGFGHGCTPGRLLVYELRGPRWRSIDVPRDPRCTVCGRGHVAQRRVG